MLPNCINCSFSNTKTTFIASRRNREWLCKATTFTAGGHFIDYRSWTIDLKVAIEFKVGVIATNLRCFELAWARLAVVQLAVAEACQRRALC